MRFLMREEFKKIFNEKEAEKRAQEEDEVSDIDEDKNKRKPRNSGPTENTKMAFIEKGDS